MDTKILDAAKKLGYAYIGVWGVMLMSAIGIYCFWRNPIGFYKALYWIGFLAGFPAAGYGIVVSNKFSSAMKEAGYRGCKLLSLSFMVLIICNLMSLTSIFGCSAALVFDGSAFYILSIFAMILFMLFPIFTAIVFSRYDRINDYFRKSFIASLIFASISVFWSPLLISLTNAGEVRDLNAGSGMLALDLIFILSYIVIQYKFIRPIFKMTSSSEEVEDTSLNLDIEGI